MPSFLPLVRPGAGSARRRRAGWGSALLAAGAGVALTACYLSDTYSGGDPHIGVTDPDAGDGGDASADADAGPQLTPCERLAQAHCQSDAARCALSAAAQGSAGRAFCEKRMVRVCEVARKLAGFSAGDEALASCAGSFKPSAGGCEGLDDPIGPCALRGALGDGEPCELGAQCKSGFCRGGGASCGSCATPLKDGDSCADDGLLCGPALVCRGDTCQERQPKDGSCEVDGHCLPGLRCAEGACKVPLLEGAACGPDADLCDATKGLYCGGIVCKRTALSINGAPCDDPPGPTIAIECEAGLRCAVKTDDAGAEHRLCQPQLDDGKACSVDADCVSPARCRSERCSLFGACSPAGAGGGGSGGSAASAAPL